MGGIQGNFQAIYVEFIVREVFKGLGKFWMLQGNIQGTSGKYFEGSMWSSFSGKFFGGF